MICAMGRALHRTELTPRQREVLRLVEKGHTNGEIATALGISLQGAKWHVRELLGKYGVQSREELIEARQAERSLGARLRALLPAVGFGLPKLSLPITLAGLGAVATVGVAGAVLALREGGSGPAAQGEAPIVESAGSSATTIMVDSGGAWTADEAVQHARQMVGAEISTRSYDHDFQHPLDLDDFSVSLVEWVGTTTRFDLPGGDVYWEAGPEGPGTLWHVRWKAAGVGVLPNAGALSADVVVDALVRDGIAAGGVAAVRVSATQPGSGLELALGGFGGFRSKSNEQRIRIGMLQIGPAYVVARANEDANGAAVETFRNAAGEWCFRWPVGVSGCGWDPSRPMLPVFFEVASRSPTSTAAGETYLAVTTGTQVDRIVVLPGDGRRIEMELSDPPDGVPRGSRYAYFELGPSLPPDRITVIGYDASGREVSRKTGSGL